MQARVEEKGWGSSRSKIAPICDEDANFVTYKTCATSGPSLNTTLAAQDASIACAYLQKLYSCVPNVCCGNEKAKAHVLEMENLYSGSSSRTACARAHSLCPNNRMSPEETHLHMNEFMQMPSLEEPRRTVADMFQDRVGWNGTHVRFVAISVVSSNLTLYNRPSEDVTRREYK